MVVSGLDCARVQLILRWVQNQLVHLGDSNVNITVTSSTMIFHIHYHTITNTHSADTVQTTQRRLGTMRDCWLGLLFLVLSVQFTWIEHSTLLALLDRLVTRQGNQKFLSSV